MEIIMRVERVLGLIYLNSLIVDGMLEKINYEP